MKLDELIKRARERAAQTAAVRATSTDDLAALEQRATAGDLTVTGDVVTAAIEARDDAVVAHDAAKRDLENLERIAAEEQRNAAETEQRTGGASRPAYDQVARVGAEERTYGAHKERSFDATHGQFRRGAKPGKAFAADVAAAFLGDHEARERLARHQREERVEREANGTADYLQRAAGTGAFAGLVVPQYLTDYYSGMPTTGRPFADVCNSHELPATGMTAYIGKVTTGTSVDDQASEGAAVSETDIDDTLLTVPIRTAAGAQTLSRQALERGLGVEDVTMGDLFARFDANLDSKLLNVATNGLTNVATAVAYTDGTPTAAELYPKVIQAQSEVVAALLNFASQRQVVVMHSRRWFWMQSQVGTSWPFIGQPGIAAQQGGVNYQSVYGVGFAGLLPNGAPVVIDNNVATNKGVGTNEDEIYVVDPAECHLWEDPQAPRFIKAEQRAAKNLQVDLVIYGYYAFEFTRIAHARKVGGTGLVTPVF